MSINYNDPVGYIDEMGEAVLLPKPRSWMAPDREYERALASAKATYADSLLYLRAPAVDPANRIEP